MIHIGGGINLPTRGMLWVFEGPDGAGKTTLAKQLAERLALAGHNCDLLAFPGSAPGTLGRHIYEFHHDTTRYDVKAVHPASLQLLHIAAHVDAIERRIRDQIEAGACVFLDRYWWSTWVYGMSSGVDQRSLELMIDVELHHWNGIQPDAVFLIDRRESLRPSIPRGAWSRLRSLYHALAGREKEKYPVHIVQNEGRPEEVVQQMVAILKKTLGSEEPPSVRNGNEADTRYVREGNQLRLGLEDTMSWHGDSDAFYRQAGAPFFYSALAPAEPTDVYDTYWYFAAERQEIFFRKLNGEPPPWTEDPILRRYKFTNAYRASDRVSQYLIKNVIYRGEQTAEELFFRILLFKVLNRIETWELLERELGQVLYADYSFDRYDEILTRAMENGRPIFSGAYIMPSGKRAFGLAKKHRNYLKLIEAMIQDDVPQRLTDMGSMKEAFELLQSYPMLGDFLAYQYVVDVNYSTLTNFSESQFVVPGPGALDGIRKCFRKLGGLNEVDIIKLVTDRQTAEFERLGHQFRSLWGRPLQLIDCQNLFCEVDKYARVAHPDVKGTSNRTRIKQKYRPNGKPIDYWYPPKWQINHLINRGRENATV